MKVILSFEASVFSVTSTAPPSGHFLILVVPYLDSLQRDLKARQGAASLMLAPPIFKATWRIQEVWCEIPSSWFSLYSKSDRLLLLSLQQRYSKLLLFDFCSFTIILTCLHGD